MTETPYPAPASRDPRPQPSTSHRRTIIAVATIIACAAVASAAIVVFGRHSTSASPQRTANTSATSNQNTRSTSHKDNVTPTTSPAPQTPYESWSDLCAESAFGSGDWVTTDHEGNKVDGHACGYTISGMDAQGDNAPQGTDYLNIVLDLTSDQPDRGADFSEGNELVALTGTTCNYNNEWTYDYGYGDYVQGAFNSPIGAIGSSDCINMISYPAAIYELTPTGYQELDSTTLETPVDPGQNLILFTSTVVPSSFSQSSAAPLLVFTDSSDNQILASPLGTGKQDVALFAEN